MQVSTSGRTETSRRRCWLDASPAAAGACGARTTVTQLAACLAAAVPGMYRLLDRLAGAQAVLPAALGQGRKHHAAVLCNCLCGSAKAQMLPPSDRCLHMWEAERAHMSVTRPAVLHVTRSQPQAVAPAVAFQPLMLLAALNSCQLSHCPTASTRMSPERPVTITLSGHRALAETESCQGLETKRVFKVQRLYATSCMANGMYIGSRTR
jgi:hypothetical protein